MPCHLPTPPATPSCRSHRAPAVSFTSSVRARTRPVFYRGQGLQPHTLSACHAMLQAVYCMHCSRPHSLLCRVTGSVRCCVHILRNACTSCLPVGCSLACSRVLHLASGCAGTALHVCTARWPTASLGRRSLCASYAPYHPLLCCHKMPGLPSVPFKAAQSVRRKRDAVPHFRNVSGVAGTPPALNSYLPSGLVLRSAPARRRRRDGWRRPFCRRRPRRGRRRARAASEYDI